MVSYTDSIFQFFSSMAHARRGLSFILTAIFGIIVSITPIPVNAQQEITNADLLEAERLLHNLGYWVIIGDERFDETARFALGAFQRTQGRPVTGKLDRKELGLLAQAKRVTFKSTSEFRIEINTSQRILYRVEPDGKMSHIVPVAIGSDRFFTKNGKKGRAHTPRGIFSIKRKLNGWRHSRFGELYYPSYFQGGLAIHGSQKMTLNSHTFGCIAVPMFAAELLSRMLKVGTQVTII